jgi:hypothetical protein
MKRAAKVRLAKKRLAGFGDSLTALSFFWFTNSLTIISLAALSVNRILANRFLAAFLR